MIVPCGSRQYAHQFDRSTEETREAIETVLGIPEIRNLADDLREETEGLLIAMVAAVHLMAVRYLFDLAAMRGARSRRLATAG